MDFDDLDAAEEAVAPAAEAAVSSSAPIVPTAKPRGAGPQDKVLAQRTGPYVLPYELQVAPSKRGSEHFWEFLEHQHYSREVSAETRELYDRLLGGGQHSYSSRVIEVTTEDGAQMVKLSAFTCTTVREVKQMIAMMTDIDPKLMQLVAKKGCYWKHEPDDNQVSSKVKVRGVTKFQREEFHCTGLIVIVGAGYGGISSAMRLLRSGRENFVIIERHHDFGGHSWISVSNKHTKLQTERGTYHVKYIYDEELPCDYMPTWPSRDQLLNMFRRDAREMGLAAHAWFNTEVVRLEDPVYATRHISVQKDGQFIRNEVVDQALKLEEREYDILCGPVGREGHQEILKAQMLLAWPGNLCFPRELTIPGEEDFEGYIEYGSGGKVAYDKLDGKKTILYGHGAFMIENVRTTLEFGAKKITIVARRRNLTAPKMISWLISQTLRPATAGTLLKAFSYMYNLAGFDPWSYHSVTTDSTRTYTKIAQTTVFGVTDIYFLANYYGKAEVIESEIKRLTRHHAHLINGRKLECEALLKVVGIVPDRRTDKIFCIQEMRGMWINGDPLRMMANNGMGVAAQNFQSFSVGPAITSSSGTLHYFVEHPYDYVKARDALPVNKATESMPAYAVSGMHYMQTGVALNSILPHLGLSLAYLDPMKARKQHIAHPLKTFLAECKAEWDMYIEMIDMPEVPPPPYPYTEELILGLINEINSGGKEQAPPIEAEAKPLQDAGSAA